MKINNILTPKSSRIYAAMNLMCSPLSCQRNDWAEFNVTVETENWRFLTLDHIVGTQLMNKVTIVLMV
jgi:hypothetical protein